MLSWSNIDLTVIFWVHHMFDTCSRSTRPLSCTRLFKKMQRMSVRDLDKMKPFHEKKQRGFQIHSFKRNDDNLAALRLVDRLARDVSQPARKEGYMPFHPFHQKLQSHVLITILFSLRFSRQNKSSSST